MFRDERTFTGKKQVRKKNGSSPYEYLAFLLSRKAYSICEVRKKMRMKEYASCEIEEVISSFVRQGFLNDELFASSLARTLTSSGYRKKRIFAKLREKGVPPEIIEEVLLEHERGGEDVSGFPGGTEENGIQERETSSAEYAAAEKALKGKIRSLNNEPDFRKRKEKALRFLAGRGFEPGVCYKVVKQLLQNNQEENIQEEF
jgi:regulatory protein